MVIAIALHLLMNARVGGAPLLMSMLNWRFREKDSPRLWPTHVSGWWSNMRQGSWSNRLQSTTALMLLEHAILVSLAAAWIISLAKPLLAADL